MRGLRIAALLCFAGGLTPAAAQHGVLAGARGGGECDVCHAPHNGGNGSYNLKTAEGALWFGRAGADALGAVSQSCLRCHGVPQIRARQPEFERLVLPGGARQGYLGFDLSDDHPLGRAGQALGRAAPARGRPVRSRLTPGGTLEVEQRGVECTRCHEPHSRRGATPQAEDESVVCGTCHDLAGFRQGHEGLPCSACHQLHGGSPQRLLREQGSDLACRSCHDAAAASFRQNRLAAGLLAPPAHVRDARATSGSCVECHTVHR